MTLCAEIENGIVKRVLVVSDMYGDLTCEQWCEQTLGGTWKQASPTGEFRKNHPSVGDAYDEQRDAFIERKQFNSWVLNENTCKYEPPVAEPKDGKPHLWDESKQTWIERKIS